MIEKADWISAEEYNCKPFDYMCTENQFKENRPPADENPNYHMLARYVFTVESGGGPVTLDITADDYYKVWINGVYIGQGPAPGYPFRYYYNRYDISGAVRGGENVIAVHTYYQGLINRVWYSADKRQGLKAVVWQEKKAVALTGKDWKYKRAEEFISNRTTGYDTYFLEDIDAGLINHGWTDLDYDDREWKPCEVNIYDDHKLVLQETKPVEISAHVPKLIKTFGEGHFLFDCGREVAGGARITVSGKRGDKIRLLFAEELDGEGHTRFELRCNCVYAEEWILSGRQETIENYDYKAFRYIEIITECKAFSEKSIMAVERHYPFRAVRGIKKDCEPLGKEIWKLCERTVMVGTQEVYVDCPTREKGQYLGDLLITGLSHLYLTGDGSMYKKALYDFAASTRIDKGMMAVSSSGIMQEIADYSLLYPLQLYYYYKITGDEKTLRELYPCAKGIVEYFERYSRKDGLLADVTSKWNMVDWPENLRDNYDFDLSIPVGRGCHSVINAYYYGAYLYLSKIEKVLFGETGRAIETALSAERVKKSFIATFYDGEKKVFVDCEGSSHSSIQTNALALYFSMQPKESEKAIAGLIREKGLCCGVYMAFFVLKGLANIKEYELEYELLTSRGEYSWVNMLEEGATTCFEAWGKEQKWNTSLCHPWACAPIIVLTEDFDMTEEKVGVEG
ncbi:MAG: family 78 glycoside hydrolase catalytic domain [Clostridium sp.]|nr:family 78 glycoside hydrolase catalytic domain [Clostridium sp.]